MHNCDCERYKKIIFNKKQCLVTDQVSKMSSDVPVVIVSIDFCAESFDSGNPSLGDKQLAQQHVCKVDANISWPDFHLLVSIILYSVDIVILHCMVDLFHGNYLLWPPFFSNK